MDILDAARTLGRLGGLVGGRAKSKRKTHTARENGKHGGRPRKYPACTKYVSHVFARATGRCYGCGVAKTD